jgi:hypothetical protein
MVHFLTIYFRDVDVCADLAPRWLASQAPTGPPIGANTWRCP